MPVLGVACCLLAMSNPNQCIDWFLRLLGPIPTCRVQNVLQNISIYIILTVICIHLQVHTTSKDFCREKSQKNQTYATLARRRKAPRIISSSRVPGGRPSTWRNAYDACVDRINIWVFPKMMVPQIIHFNRVFHYKPFILGYPYSWKHPYCANITAL